MGFRNGAYATVWEATPVSDTRTKVRLSISKKNRQTGEYEQDFSGFVTFVGTACARKAAKLREKDRIKLGEVDVQNRYDREKNTTFYNPAVFSFETAEEAGKQTSAERKQQRGVDHGEIDDSRLPF